MRIRKKVWAEPELQNCSYFIKEPVGFKNCWQDKFYEKQPIHLDLGCGKGVFLAQIAYNKPDINYIGIDISQDILGVARRNIEETFQDRSPENVLLFKYNIEKLGEVFSAGDGIERIYINFCNPWPKSRGHKKRLTHPRQLEEFFKFLNPGVEIWFKTDDSSLYLATLRYFKETGMNIKFQTEDLHSVSGVENVLTEHEIKFSAQRIPIKAIVGEYKGGDNEE